MNKQIEHATTTAVGTLAATTILLMPISLHEMDAAIDKAMDEIRLLAGVDPVCGSDVDDYRKMLMAACTWTVSKLAALNVEEKP